MMTLLEAAAHLRAGKLSSQELVTDSLAQIKQLNPTLNAFMAITGDAALNAARVCDEELAAGRR